MILNDHSDVSYLSTPKARRRTDDYFFLGSLPCNRDPITLNGAIHVSCIILKLVAASAAEAKLGALFLNAQEAKVFPLILAKLGHPQLPTPIYIDNTTTVGIVKNTIKHQQSRVMEMQFFWLLYGETQQYFKFYYQPGLENLGDYPSRQHTANIHQHVRPYHVHMDNSPTLSPQAMKLSTCGGCAEILGDPYFKKSPLPSVGPPLIWPSPLQIPVTNYLARQEYNRDTPLATTTLQ
jgi:hypothetical protein